MRWTDSSGCSRFSRRYPMPCEGSHGLIHCNTLINAAGRRVWGFHGIGPVLKLPMATCDGWQKVWPTEHPFSKPQQEKIPL